MLRTVAMRTGVIARQARPACFARVCVSAAPRVGFHTSSQDLMPYKMPEEGGKARLGFIPEEWFTFFYNKTGVTGPYVFGAGFLMYLLNKEIYVIGHETLHGVIALSFLVYGVKKFGPLYTAAADKAIDEQLAGAQDAKDAELKNYKDLITSEQKEQWRLDGRDILSDAKNENVAMQLETAYRERLHMVVDQVKKKLDYHVEVVNLKRRVQQDHMADWIEKNVIQSITPEQEKTNIAQCIKDLRSLSVS